MIRLLRRVGRLKAGTETDMFSAAEEAAFVLDGTAEAIEEHREAPRRAANAPEAATVEAPDYSRMKKDDLLREAMARGLDVSPRAKVPEIIDALESSDDA